MTQSLPPAWACPDPVRRRRAQDKIRGLPAATPSFRIGAGPGLLLPNTSGPRAPPLGMKAGALWQVTQLALCSALECS